MLETTNIFVDNNAKSTKANNNKKYWKVSSWVSSIVGGDIGATANRSIKICHLLQIWLSLKYQI